MEKKVETEPGEELAELQVKQAKKPDALAEELLDAPLVHGGLWKAIWLMSWPLLISTFTMSTVGLVDVQVAAYLGRSAQAAVGLSEMVIFIFMIFIMSIGVGTTAVVSREFGEGNREGTLTGTAQSLLSSVVSGIVLAILALTCAKYLLPLFGRSQEVVEQGYPYLAIFGLYMLPFSVISIAGNAFRAIGDSRTPLLIVLCEVVINIIGDYASVLGNWPVPGLGIRGIAASAVVSAAVAAIATIILLYRSPLKESLFRLNKFEWSWQKRILGTGLPSAVQRFGWTGSTFAVFYILSFVKDHVAALAAWTIGMRVEGMLFMPLMALSLAVSSIVGQNLGAKREDRAIKAGWNVTWCGVVMMVVMGGLMYFGADIIASTMTHDPTTIKFTSSYLRINAFCEPFLAIAMVLMGAMQGAGDTRMNMWISLFCNWVIRLPIAWYLAITLGMQTNGVWYAMVSSVLMCALLCTLRYQSGRWLKARV